MVSQLAADSPWDPNQRIQGDQQQAPPQQQGGGGLLDQWNSFIDHPEHRAGLMQFAVNMLAGKGLGESIGSAAEATGRNVAAQEEEQKYEEAQALKEEEQARKEKETEYYGIAARKKSGADTYYEHLGAREEMANRMAGQKEFDAWMADQLPDARFKALQQRHPELKSKADLWDPKYAGIKEEAKGMFRGMGSGGRGPPPGAESRMGADGRVHYFDPRTKKYLGSSDGS